MKKKDLIGKIAEMLFLDVEVLTKGLTSEEEVEIAIPELKIHKSEDFDTLLDNKGKERYDAGKMAGSEMTLKGLSEMAGIEKVKTSEDFFKASKAKILEDANVEPEKKVAELQTSIENLQTQIVQKDDAFSKLQGDIAKEKTTFKVMSYIPELPDGVGLTKDEASILFFRNHEIKDDGIYKDGKLLKDNLENSLSLEESVSGFVAEKGWNKTPSGRGGGSGGGSGNTNPTTYAEFEALCDKKGFGKGSVEANALLSEIAKENPEILD